MEAETASETEQQEVTEETEETEETETDDAFGQEYLAKVYPLMEQKNYEGLKKLTTSAEAQEVLNGMKEDVVTYQPDRTEQDISGTGVGLYRYHGKGGVGTAYYYYFGDYDDGIRHGNGFTFHPLDGGWERYEGNWESDVPQETFTKKETGLYNGEPYEATTTGNMTDGLENGDFKETVNALGLQFEMNWTSENGVALDIYDGFEDWVKQYLAEIHQPGYSLYALSMPSDGQNVYLWWNIYDPFNEKLGIYKYTFE
ncbi:MAG: hypothetical protein IJJ13_04105 [Lachnospiraceae bacterium]|nr:hypothetical protein [Lachnospiraceae bacterium]